jgi:hypothetical protein
MKYVQIGVTFTMAVVHKLNNYKINNFNFNNLNFKFLSYHLGKIRFYDSFKGIYTYMLS